MQNVEGGASCQLLSVCVSLANSFDGFCVDFGSVRVVRCPSKSEG